MKLYKPLFGFFPLFLFLLVSCSQTEDPFEKSGKKPPIFPDYSDVTVPVNIAPLNFEVTNAQKILTRIKYEGKTLKEYDGKYEIKFPLDEWHKLLKEYAGKDLMVSVCVWDAQHPKGIQYADFPIHVSKDSIDPWIAYRLIPPGYELWNRMGIYQRSLENYTEETIVSNRQNNDGCVNCHSFNQYNPNRLMFHARGENGGTVIWKDGILRKIALEKYPPNKSGTYPMWHPNGRFIVFSSNTTRQSFYGHSRDKIEVYDLASDLILYDTEKDRMISDPRFLTDNSWETFPAFSPNGKWLYYCGAQAQKMPPDFNKLKYALCRVAFNPSTGALGQEIDTLYNPRLKGGSVSFPRISPDGQFLMYTWAQCATFPIHHKEADLKMIRLSDKQEIDTRSLNSKDVESYHSWSSNGKWILFSSKRIDTRYTRLFIAHMTKDGTFSKPFLLPQKSPKLNKERIYSFNIPEFIKGKVSISKDAVHSLFL